MFHVATRASSGVQEVVVWKGLFLGPQRQEKLETQIRASPVAPDTWKCKRAQVSLKATIDVPMLGTITEENGDGLRKIPTCLWDGHSTSMALSDNAVFTELLAYKNSMICSKNMT